MKAHALAAALVVSLPAFAQVQVNVALPTISFPAPPTLVVVEPGVQVVQDYDDEVFFVDGWYWHRRGPHWYRTQVHTGGWVLAEPRHVPVVIVKSPVGRYRRWRGPAHKATVVVNPPGPGKVKVKVKHKHR
ncbi:MAG: hypothetical protein ACYC8T_30210 [Myxococcaceae bacterium]